MNSDNDIEGEEAICFTAGTKGLFFQAGVIHAWLAADRKAPVVVAGTTTGNLSAAALSRSFQEMKEATGLGRDREIGRWSWYRKYFANISHSPLDVLWRAIPDRVDLVSKRAPLADPSCPADLQASETEARNRYYLLTIFANWLADLPLKVSTFASAVFAYVEWNEKKTAAALVRVLWYGARAAGPLLLHFSCNPAFFRPCRSTGKGKVLFFRPLFGARWLRWSFGVLAATILIAGGLLFRRVTEWPPEQANIALARLYLSVLAVLAIYVIHELFVVMRFVFRFLQSRDSEPDDFLWQILSFVNNMLGVEEDNLGLLHDHELHRRLFRLFGDETLTEGQETKLVILASPLQKVWWEENGQAKPIVTQQVWAEPGIRIVDALLAAVRESKLFGPKKLVDKQIAFWVKPGKNKAIHLVGADLVSYSPLPLLMAWLKDSSNANEAARKSLFGSTEAQPTVYVVYSDPVATVSAEVEPKSRRDEINILQAAKISFELRRRRDIKDDSEQTKFVSEMQEHIHSIGGDTKFDSCKIKDLAPVYDVAFKNFLDPTVEEIRRNAAQGCRTTLTELYQAVLEKIDGPVSCKALLTTIAPKRAAYLAESPGIPEICGSCSGVVKCGSQVHKSDKDPRVESADTLPPEQFPHLNREKPRIVFLASGGVFRGSFHVGVIAALHAIGIKPDLIVGASVGALMGAALGAISASDLDAANKTIEDLALTYLCVDEKVALTHTLRELMKHLSVRAKQIHVSPKNITDAIRDGGTREPGYATTGSASRAHRFDLKTSRDSPSSK